MHILITSAASSLALSLADRLSDDHTVRLTERTPVPSDHEFVLCALGHDASTNLLVRGMDAIVHVAEPLPNEDENAQIDAATRCTYNLLMAATEEAVPKVIYLSTLELMAAYDADFRVDEHWRPRPRPQPPTLSKHLGEFVCREFAREGKVAVTVLRPGIAPTSRIAEAVEQALAADAGIWSILHVEE